MSAKWTQQYRNIFGQIPKESESEHLTSHPMRPSEATKWGAGDWSNIPNERGFRDRKYWESAFIAQALSERGLMVPDKFGLGFACGTEPLPSLLASFGCRIIATDAPFDNCGWSSTGQKSNKAEELYHKELINKESFDRLVSFQYADMNNIPDFGKKFDFIWSACALEHLGCVHKSKDFVYRSADLLKPGGIAVHTTEFNLRSQVESVKIGDAIALTAPDFIEIAEHLSWDRYKVAQLDFRLDCEEYTFVEARAGLMPKEYLPHCALVCYRQLFTSFGLIIQKGQD